jgi:predicted acyl esterase
LVYHCAPFERDTEVSGFFRLSAWLSIDQPDTDFSVSVYEIDIDGNSILLSNDVMRARYREGLRERPQLVRSSAPLRYDFDRFTFVSHLIRKGSRLRLTVGPINSMYVEKNYNSGGVVAEESMRDARPVTVKLLHDRDHPSALYVPIAQPQVAGEPQAPSSALLPNP